MPPFPPESDDFDPSARRLCPDEACIGVLDADGTCPACGKRGEPAAEGSTSTSASALPSAPEAAPAERSAPAQPATEGFDSQRRLCPDGACVGVVEQTDRCNVCGRSAS